MADDQQRSQSERRSLIVQLIESDFYRVTYCVTDKRHTIFVAVPSGPGDTFDDILNLARDWIAQEPHENEAEIVGVEELAEGGFSIFPKDGQLRGTPLIIESARVPLREA